MKPELAGDRDLGKQIATNLGKQPKYVFTWVGGRRLEVDIPMKDETVEALVRAQRGIAAPMTEQMRWAEPKEKR